MGLCHERRRLLVLANKSQGVAPGQRYRFEQWAPRLERDHGISLDILPFESPELTALLYEPGHYAAKARWTVHDMLRRFAAVRLAKHYDAVLVFREAALVGPPLFERMLSRAGRPIIYDFDDAIWSPRQERLNGLFARLRFVGKTRTICRLATAVTVGSRYLADYAEAYNPSVHIVPSSIELDDYPLLPEATDDGKFVVCWTGSASTLVHLEAAREALERLATMVPLVVKVIGSRPPERPFAGAETRFIRWSAQGEAQEVGDCHVGIMPLPDNEVTRGKCAMKALQYMATGRPAVVSPVGANLDVVTHGENGLLASSTEDFVSSLLELARSPDLRKKLGLAARKTVERRFSAEVASRKFAAVVASVVDRRASPKEQVAVGQPRAVAENQDHADQQRSADPAAP